MPRFRETIPVDDYVLDVLMRDIVGHDHQPAAFLIYLYFYGQAVRARWTPVPASLRMLADDRSFKERRANRVGAFAPPRADRDNERSHHHRAEASRAAALAGRMKQENRKVFDEALSLWPLPETES